MVWQLNEALTFIISSCTWYKQHVVHIDAPILTINHNLKPDYPLKASFAEVNRSLTPVMPLAEANQSFIPVIHSDAISRS
jgi:hypothetical protein